MTGRNEVLEEFTKLMGVLEVLCDGMKSSAEAQNASMQSLVEQREHVALAAKAMYKNSEVMEKAVEAFTNDIKNLSSRMDKFAETNTEMLTGQTKILAEQKAVCSHLVDIAKKLDGTESRFREHEKKLGSHDNRITVIESLRDQTKNSKATLISTLGVMIAAGALLVAILQRNDTPPPPPPSYQTKP